MPDLSSPLSAIPRLVRYLGSVAILCAVPAVAQEHDPLATSAVLREAVGLQRVDGVVRGIGPDYRATFDREGIRFVPALGRRAPRTVHLRFVPQAVGRRDGSMQTIAAAAPEIRGHDVVYCRGAVTERYELVPRGIEQSFTFSALPEGRGDLVVRGLLTTELPLAEATPDLLRFELPDVGGVIVRDVVGIDANGRRAIGHLRLGDAPAAAGDMHRVELVLPAAFVDAAALPLVLDPLIGSSLPLSSGPSDEFPGVAHEPDHDVYLVAWTRFFSATDQVLVGQRVDPDGQPVGGLIEIRQDVALDATHVAAVDARDTFLISGHSQTGPPHVSAVHAGTGAVTGHVQLPTSAGFVRGLSGASGPTDDGGIVVWEDHGSRIARGARVTVAADGSLSVGAAVDLGLGKGHLWCTISPSSGSSGLRMIVAANYNALATDHDGVIVDRELNVLAVFPVAPRGTFLQPQVDGDGRSWVVAFLHPEAGPGVRDIACRSVAFDPRSNEAVVGPIEVIDRPGTFEQAPSVVWLGGSALVLFEEMDTGTGRSRAWHVASRDPYACTVCEGSFGVQSPGVRPAGAARHRGPGLASEALLVVTNNALGSRVEAQLFRADDGHEWDRRGGCGGGTSYGGCAIVGNAAHTLRLRDAPTGAHALCLLGARRANLPCGSCVLVPDPGSGVVFPAGSTGVTGRASVTVPVPAVSALRGAVLFEQWLVGPAPGRCLGVVMSNAREIRLE